MRKIFLILIVLFVNPCFGDEVFVELSNVPADGFIVCPLDMTPAINWLSQWENAEFFYESKKLDAVFVPNSSGDPNRGTFVALLPEDIPKNKPCRLRIEHKDGIKTSRSEQIPTVRIAAHSLIFETYSHGGLPVAMVFPNENILETLKWFDRLHDPVTGSWSVANDKIELLVDEPFLTVVQTTAIFKQDNNVPPSKPKAEYQWFIFPKRELVYVTVFTQQDEPTEWKEKHLLELHIPDGSFGKWFGDDKSGTFTGTKQSQIFSRYSGFLDDSNNVIAAIGSASIYDGLNDFGPYLLKGGDAWQPWTDTQHRLTAWYWIGNTPEPAKTLQSAYETVTKMPHAEIVIPALETTVIDWQSAALNELFLSGNIASKEELERLQNNKKLPKNWYFHSGNDALAMIFEITDNQEKGKGFRLLSLVDKKTNTILSARESVSLFSAELLDKTTGKIISINSDSGWQQVEEQDTIKEGQTFLFQKVHLPEAEELQIRFVPDSPHQPPGWSLEISPSTDRYEFRKLNFPQIALRNFGSSMKTFYPHASGVVTENPVGNELHWRGRYPSGWCSMQITATYDETKKTGLYLARHDPGGSVKDILLNANSAADSLTIRFEQPLPLYDNTHTIVVDGCVVQALHGDWYDAAVLYRHWVRECAEWYPRQKLDSDGRTDTPQWMKELCVWAQHWESPQKMPEIMRQFTDALGVPTAVHWYGWHQIPFDNDYPHYFPTRDGFKEAVTEIQKNGDCYVMPYINGRLWDTRDKGVEDCHFTPVALPGATKKEDGKPYIETYGSKESDGSNVELAVMCPASGVWKNKVTENITRLMNECGVAGVYVDQVAAERQTLCFDKSHGHPLAGGDWWNRAYWKMFEKIRSEMPKDKMLTTECNAEPYVNIFDGYLTWHFQSQDQVPAFAAVYGGAVQMFGRAYRGGPSQVMADRMKAAQQLVFGEQIGWLDPRIVNDPKRFPFFKDVVQMRYKFRDYFYKGEMIRPPKLLDTIPTVTADWQWSGETLITTDAVLTGAWRKVNEEDKTLSAVFMFVNVSDEPITSRVKVNTDLPTDVFDKPLTFDPGVQAFELAR